MSQDNKAILYTEIEEWNGRETVMQYIDQMSDNNPKKWYLKGLLAAIRLAEKKAEEPLTFISDDDNDEEADDAKENAKAMEAVADEAMSLSTKKLLDFIGPNRMTRRQE